MINLAAVILNNTKTYNGHLQFEVVGYTPSLEDTTELLKELEDIEGDSFMAEYWSDGGFNIYQLDYWEKGEHPLGHIHRLVAGFQK